MGPLSVRFVALLVWALSLLSLEGQRSLGRLIGALAWHFRTDSRRITEINLRACFPELEDARRRELARESLRHTGMLFTELGAVYRWPERRWRALAVESHGEELIAGGGRRGVLVLAPHLGNWEYLALVLGRHSVTALYDPPRLRSMEPLIREARARSGARLLPIDAGGLRAIYRTLAEGGLAAVLPDQVPAREAGVYADFFGVPALTMTFAQRVARRTGAQVLLATATRRPGGFRVSVEPAPAALHDPDPEAAAHALNVAIEDLVRRDPAQYQWEYKRFKRQRRGDPDPYARRR